MTLRRPTLDEWFNAYQHRHITREHSFMPGFVSVDVTAVVRDWEARGERAPFPAILAKAAALAAVEHPQANRLYLRTLWGDRVAELDGVHINLPMRMRHGERHVLTVNVLRDADRRSVAELRDEIWGHVRGGLGGTTLTKLVATRPNTWYWRLVLRVLHFVVWRWPLVPRYGGAITVTCPTTVPREGRPRWFTGPSPTALLIALSEVRKEADRTWLDLGVMADHLVLDGVDGLAFADTFADILEGKRGVELLR
ncbi:MAG: hypothetical protein AAF602_32325 [Myxococcota bacterium]